MSQRIENLTLDQINEAYYFDDKANLDDACLKLGISRRILDRSMRALGLEGKDNKRNYHRKCKFPKLLDKEWLKKEKETKSDRQIARELGTSSGNVRDHSVRHGLTPAVSEDASAAVREGIKKTFPEGRKGEKSNKWKGGRIEMCNRIPFYLLEEKPQRYVTSSKYVYVMDKDHWRANQFGYVLEHYKVMEEHLGRRLLPQEQVKHKSKDREDNSIENLYIFIKIKKETDKERSGSKAGHWKGGRRQLDAGYIYIYRPDHPMATLTGYVMEHRLKMEEKIGRILYDHEVVHHKDGVKNHNDIDNLELKDNATHISDHFKDGVEVGMLRKENEALKAQLAAGRIETQIDVTFNKEI